MKTLRIASITTIIITIVSLHVACHTTATFNESAIRKELLSEMKASERAWNDGSLERFMGSYLRSEKLVFAGNGEYSHGWNEALERYKKGYPDQAAMGKLTFSEMAITVLTGDAALVFGRWHLDKTDEESSGLFTLLFRKTDEGWRIVHDHSSAP